MKLGIPEEKVGTETRELERGERGGEKGKEGGKTREVMVGKNDD
jgi:hypothetical protein